MKNSHSIDEKKFNQFFMKLLAPRKDEILLDLGCGHGNEIKTICQSQPIKKIYGLDFSEKHITAAKKNLRKHLTDRKVELNQFDASNPLPFPANHFDAVYSLDLLECLGETSRNSLLKEIHRILKPDGRLAMEHTDWDTQVWNTRHKELGRKLVHAFCDTQQNWMTHVEGQMGRKLWEWVHQKPLFKNPQIETYVLTNTDYKPGLLGHNMSQALVETLGKKKSRVSEIELAQFLADLKIQAKKKRYFYSVNRYVLITHK